MEIVVKIKNKETQEKLIAIRQSGIHLSNFIIDCINSLDIEEYERKLRGLHTT